MKELLSKKTFLRQLKKNLRFKYSKDDINSILNDYNEFFDIEIAQGKAEETVCLSLGDPITIVANLYQETGQKKAADKSVFSKRSMLQIISILILCFIIVNLVYKVEHSSQYMMVELLVSYPIIVSLLWFLLKKATPVVEIQMNKNSLVLLKNFHYFCFLTVLSLFFFFHNIVIGIAKQNTGPIVVNILYLLMVLLCGLVLFSISQFHKGQIAFYGLICHALGAIAIIVHYINILHSLSTINTFLIEARISWLLYLEAILAMIIFTIINYKRKTKIWMHN